jgi:hypothetical protein
MVERARAVAQQLADHRHALHGYRAGRGQMAGQRGERPGRSADPGPAQRQACRMNGISPRWHRAGCSPAAARIRCRLVARTRRDLPEVSCTARAARLMLVSGLVPAASSRSSRAAAQRASMRCQGCSRTSVRRPRSSRNRTCLVRPWPTRRPVCVLPVVVVIVAPGVHRHGAQIQRSTLLTWEEPVPDSLDTQGQLTSGCQSTVTAARARCAGEPDFTTVLDAQRPPRRRSRHQIDLSCRRAPCPRLVVG